MNEIRFTASAEIVRRRSAPDGAGSTVAQAARRDDWE